MAKYYDLILSNYDLVIENGDFKVDESSQQETDLLINTSIGNWFQYPLIGVGILNYLAGATPAAQLKAIIQTQLEQDGFVVNTISITGTTIDSIKIDLTANRP
jgi:hypothetical protein